MTFALCCSAAAVALVVVSVNPCVCDSRDHTLALMMFVMHESFLLFPSLILSASHASLRTEAMHRLPKEISAAHSPRFMVVCL